MSEYDDDVTALRAENASLRQELAKVAAAGEKFRASVTRARITDAGAAALERHGCRRPEAALRLLRDELRVEDDGITVEAPNGAGVDEYVAGPFRARVPELFDEPQLDGSTATPRYKFSIEQLRDTAFYMENREAIREALEAGRVRL